MPEREHTTATTEDDAILREFAEMHVSGMDSPHEVEAQRRQSIRLPHHEPQVISLKVPAETLAPQEPSAAEAPTPAPEAPVAEVPVAEETPAETVTVQPLPESGKQVIPVDQNAKTQKIRQMVAEIQAEKEAELARKRAKAADPRTIFQTRPWLTGEIKPPHQRPNLVLPGKEEEMRQETMAPARKMPVRLPQSQPSQTDEAPASLAESILNSRMAAEEVFERPAPVRRPQAPVAYAESEAYDEEDFDEVMEAAETGGNQWWVTALIALSGVASAAMVAYLFILK